MVISCDNVNRDISTDDKTLLTERQRFICMFYEDILNIRRTAAHLASSGMDADLANDIVEKLMQIIGITQEISLKVSEEMTGAIPRSSTDQNDWS